MSRTASIIVDLLMRTGSFVTDAKRAEKAIDSLGKRAGGLAGEFRKGLGGGLMQGLAAAAGVAALTALAKHTLDAADSLSKLSQRTGASTEELSALQYAFKLGGVEGEGFATGMKKLAQNMSEAARGTEEQAAAFEAMGIKVKNADGSLRKTEDVLGDIADKFSQWEDGPEKVALAIALLGRAGETMIPTLNGGRAAMKAMREEAEKLGIVVSTQVGKDIEQFNDTLTKVGLATQGTMLAVLTKMLPALQAIADEMVKVQIEGRSLRDELGDFALEGVRAFALVAEAVVGLGRAVYSLSGSFQSVFADIKFMGTLAERGMFSVGSGGLLNEQNRAAVASAFDERQRMAAEANQRYIDLWNYDGTRITKAIDKALAASRAPQASYSNEGRNYARAEKKRAPGLPGKGSAGVEQLAQAQLRAELEAIKDAAEQRKKALTFGQQYVQGAYDAALIDLRTNLDEQRRLRDEAVQSQVAAANAEIAALTAYRDKTRAGTKERIDAEAKIADAVRKRAQVQADAATAAVLADQREAAAIKALKREYTALWAEVFEAQGRGDAAASIRIAQQRDAAEATLRRFGADPEGASAQADAYAETLVQLDRLRRSQGDYNALVERARLDEEAIILDARARGDTEIETMQRVRAVRQDALDELGEMAAKARELAEQLKTPEAEAFAKALANAFKRASAEVDPLMAKVRELADEMGQSIAQGFEDAIVSGGSLRDVLKGIEQDLLRILTRKLVTEPLGNWLSKAIGGGGGITNFFSSLFGGGRAGGGAVDAGRMYEVNERGMPEMLKLDGRQFLLMGNRRGWVDPAPQATPRAGAATWAPVFHMTFAPGTTVATATQAGAAVARRLQAAAARNA